MLGLTTLQTVVLLSRGPHCDRYTWFGYEGGMEWRKSSVEGRASSDMEKGANQVGAEEASREAPKDENDKSMPVSSDRPPKV